MFTKPVNTMLQMSAPDPRRPHPVEFLRSDKHPLVFSGFLSELTPPTVTVELYVKWYSLFVIQKMLYDEVIIEEVPFPDDEFCGTGESPYCDHVPNPAVVARWAASKGYVIDDAAMEMMIGRWEREYKDRYSETYVNLPEHPKPPCTLCGGKGFVEVVGLTDPALGQAINPCKCRLKED